MRAEHATRARATAPFAPMERNDRLGCSDLLTHNKHYRIDAVIGQGGMGVVYRAHDPVLERDVAIKVMKPDLPGAARHRFREEALWGARLSHPSLCRVYDLGILPERGLDWFAMELLVGRDLEGLLRRAERRQRRLPPTLVIRMFERVLDALIHAHAAGVVHRDVKPGNIFVVRAPGGRAFEIKLLDFGVALDVSGSAALAHEICGDPRYMAPEQTSEASVDMRADLYATGISLFEALTGRHPFAECLGQSAMAMVEAQRTRPLPIPSHCLPSDVPRALCLALDDVIARACAKRPGDRFEDAAEMQRALTGALAEPV